MKRTHYIFELTELFGGLNVLQIEVNLTETNKGAKSKETILPVNYGQML